LRGVISTAQQESLADHLDGCPSCLERLSRLDGPADPLLGALRGVTAVPTIAEPAVRELLDRGPGDGPTGPPVDVGGRVGPYLLLAKLGEGGMGAVYRARHERLGKVFALKVLPPGRRDPARETRFEREMRAVGRLEHPHIVRATDAGEDRGVPFLAMELIDGIDLSRLVRRRGPLRPAEACEAIRQAALALAHAHDRGLIHRDVKPSNLLLTSDGKVMLLDLGLALAAGDPVEPLGGARGEAPTEVGHVTLTETGMAVGTRDYMAPEQATAPHAVDARADVYGLGATLHFLLTGRPPRDPAPRPVGLAALLDRMLAPDPADRFQTAAEVAIALARRSRGHDLAALIAGRPPRRRQRHLILGAILVVVAGVALGLTAARLWPRHPGETAATAPPLAPAQPAPDPPLEPVDDAPAPLPKPPPASGHLPMTPDEAQQLQQGWADYLGQPVEIRNTIGMKLVLIPPGEFELAPRYHVTITRPYRLGTTEVTRRQFLAFVSATRYVPTGDAAAVIKPFGANTGPKNASGTWRDPGFPTHDNCPITHVSCADAESFADWLSKTEGKKYRLPTEAEWRWACRAGAKTRYPFGDSPANVYQYRAGSSKNPVAVASYRPNAWGLYDMIGNVREWVADGFEPYPEGRFTDRVAANSRGLRTACGGSFEGRTDVPDAPGWKPLTCDCNTVFGRQWYECTVDQGFRICLEP
jgi:formylglycine-generating enzyme required for sulfatase activity